MWGDKGNWFNTYGTSQAVTLVDDNISDNVIDLTSTTSRQIIDGAYFVVQCDAVPISAGGGDLNIQLVTSAGIALAAPQILWSSGVITNAVIVAYTANTTLYAIRVPAYLEHRYMGVIYTIATAVWTAGSFRAFLTPEAPYYIPASP